MPRSSYDDMSSSLRFFEWKLNRSSQTIRLQAINDQVVLMIYLSRKPIEPIANSFCTSTFDAITNQCFNEASSIYADLWIDSKPGKLGQPWQESGSDNSVSRAFLDLIHSQLSDALRNYREKMQRPLTGSFLLVTVEDVPEKPGQASLIVQADLYREHAFADLQELAQDSFPDITRIDLSKIARYVNTIRENVFRVETNLDANTGTLAIFKTLRRLPDWEAQKRTKKSEKNAQLDASNVLKEVETVVKLSGHPNTADLPLALVTIQDDTHGGSDKLVGWLQRVYEDWPFGTFHIHKHTFDASLIPERIEYAIGLARGMLHMQEQGFIHPDLHWQNLLFARDGNSRRLVIIDCNEAHASWYNNLSGPNSPEAAGFLKAIETNGRLAYILQARPDAKTQYRILTDLSKYPEALERLQVFTFAWVAARLFGYSIPYKSDWPQDYINAVGTRVSHWPGHAHAVHCERQRQAGSQQQTTDDAMRDAWEKLIPDWIKNLLDRCSAFCPLDRPLLVNIIHTLENDGQ